MNILIIGTIDKGGGAAKISWDVKTALEAAGHEVSMLVADKLSDDPKVRVIPRTVHRYVSYLIADDTSLFDTDWILESEEFKRADVVHCHNLHGFYFNLDTLRKMSLQKPVVWTLHDMWAITPHCAHAFDGALVDGFYQCRSLSSYPRIAWHNERRLMARKRRIYEGSPRLFLTAPSEWLAGKVAKSALGSKPLTVIPNGIDTATFAPQDTAEARRELGLPLDKKVVLFVGAGGRHNEYKGWQYAEGMVRRFAGDDSIRFVHIGGEEKDIALAAPNVTILPPVKDPKRLALYYAAADAFLYPSLAESFGLVVAESLACGTPVVTFETGGIPEVARHMKEGYVARYRDEDDLERGLRLVLGLPTEKRAAMARSGVERVRELFATERMAKAHIDLYTSLI